MYRHRLSYIMEPCGKQWLYQTEEVVYLFGPLYCDMALILMFIHTQGFICIVLEHNCHWDKYSSPVSQVRMEFRGI